MVQLRLRLLSLKAVWLLLLVAYSPVLNKKQEPLKNSPLWQQSETVLLERVSFANPKISPFDELFRRHASTLDWDWRLLVSLAFHESTFNPMAVSRMGAVGLLQVLPSTSREFGEFNLLNPEENVEAGVLFLKYLYDRFADIPDPEQRVMFTIASYNAGFGHVQDARRLARKYGRDPDLWENHTENFLLKKAQKEFYGDTVVRFGYCRGEEPVRLVRRVFKKFHSYMALDPA